MELIQHPDFDAPFQNDTLLQIRTSKMKPMRNLSIMTGIYKAPRVGRVFVSFTGIESDEHDLTFHGGVDKAVHQYCPHHYPSWRAEYPESALKFEVGGFGENLVSENMNERNVCIGDQIRIGEVLLEVSLPRQPCFKLNHRFEIKAFAAQTWRKSRTGWYYRVLKEGWIEVGNSIELVERRHPTWTIERVQEYLHRNTKNLEKLMELQTIEEFGNECKGAFKRMIANLRKEESKKANGEKKAAESWEDFQIIEKKVQTKRITSFILEATDKAVSAEDLDPGSFARVKLPNGLIRPYSIVSGNTRRFELGIALEPDSRGGSRYLHESMSQGDILLIGKLSQSVPIPEGSSNHIFLAGGIGITAFLPHTDIFDQINFNYELHYAVRCADDIPFKSLLDRMGSKLIIYDGSKGDRMNIAEILKNRKWNSYTYACGPQRMMDDTVRAANACGVSPDEIHYEAFEIATSGDPFSVELAKTKKKLDVGGDETLLEVMRAAGLEVDSSCEAGNCGTCRVDVCSGKVEHRGSALSEEDKKTSMLSCVSRGIGHIVIDVQ